MHCPHCKNCCIGFLFTGIVRRCDLWHDEYAMNRFQTAKPVWILITVFIMLAVSRMIVRIVDAAVQIDDDIGILLFLLFIVNALIAVISHRIYLRTKNQS